MILIQKKYIFFNLVVCEDFCLNIQRKFTKTVEDNAKGFKIHIETEDYLFSKAILF